MTQSGIARVVRLRSCRILILGRGGPLWLVTEWTRAAFEADGQTVHCSASSPVDASIGVRIRN